MAAPESEFRPAGLTVPQLTPSIYRPTPVNVPSQAGELWAQVGQNLMRGSAQVFDVLKNYPQLKSDMTVGLKAAGAASDFIDQLKAKGMAGYVIGTDPGTGRAYLMPAGGSGISPTVQTLLAPDLNKGKTGTTGGAPQTINPPQPQDQNPPPGTPQTGYGSEPTPGWRPGQPLPSTEEQMKPVTQATPASPFTNRAAVTPPAAPGFQGPNQTQTNAAVQQALQRNQFASSGQGVPAGYQPPQGGPGGAPPGQFLNPATGSYEPLQQGPPPAPGPPAPLRPPAPVPPAQQPLAQALNPQAQQTQPNWAQGPGAAVVGATPSLHPVMSSQTALDWAKGFDSSAQRAVYLPQTPGGEPGFAIYGPKNKPLGPPIPISQMVRHGATGLAAGENLSSILNVADQQQAQQQAAQTNQPGNMLLQPPQQPQGGAQGAPAAPGQGPLLTSTAYNPAPYQQAVAQAMQNPQNLTAQTGQAGQPAQPQLPPGMIAPAPTISQEDQDALQTAASRAPTGGDQLLPVHPGGLNFYVNNDPDAPWRGRVFTSLPAENTTQEARFYLGTAGYQPVDLKESNMRRIIRQEYQGKQPGIALTDEDINNLKPPEMKDLLQRAAYWNNHPPSDPTTGPLKSVNAAYQSALGIQRLIDEAQVLKDKNIKPEEYTKSEVGMSRSAAEQHGLTSEFTGPEVPPYLRAFLGTDRLPGGFGEWWGDTWRKLHGQMASGRSENDFLDQMRTDLKSTTDYMKLVSSPPRTPEERENQRVSLGGGYGGIGGSVNFPAPTGSEVGETGIRELDRIFEEAGGDPNIQQKGIDGLKELKKTYDTEVQRQLADAERNGYRTSPAIENYDWALKHGKYTADPNNKFRDEQGNVRDRYPEAFAQHSALAKTSPTPYPAPASDEDYRNIPVGRQYTNPLDPNGPPLTKKP